MTARPPLHLDISSAVGTDLDLGKPRPLARRLLPFAQLSARCITVGARRVGVPRRRLQALSQVLPVHRQLSPLPLAAG